MSDLSVGLVLTDGETYRTSAQPSDTAPTGVLASVRDDRRGWFVIGRSSDQLRALAAALTEAAERFDALAHSQALAARKQEPAEPLPPTCMDGHCDCPPAPDGADQHLPEPRCDAHADRVAVGGTIGPDGMSNLCRECLDQAEQDLADELAS